MHCLDSRESCSRNISINNSDGSLSLEILMQLWCSGGGINKLVRISNGSRVLPEMHGYGTRCCGNTGNRLVSNIDVQDKIIRELSTYKNAEGLFGIPIAIRSRKTLTPAKWWKLYGNTTPNLQQVAIKILSLTCSASGCEPLKARYDRCNVIDPISLVDIDESNEWLIGKISEEDTTIHVEDGLVFTSLNWDLVVATSQLDFEEKEINLEDIEEDDNEMEGYQSSLDGSDDNFNFNNDYKDDA
ncbi:hypothetical protein AAG906_041148 [Vitis piasezkii]